LKEKGIAATGATSATDEEANGTGAKAEPDGVPVTVFSSAGNIFCADLSSERLESLSPSQKGFSASLTGRGTRGTGSVCEDEAVKFNTGTGTGDAGVFARNWEDAKKLGILPLPLEVGADAERLSGPGVDLGSNIGTEGITGAGSLDGRFETRVGGFEIPSVFAASKKDWAGAGTGSIVDFAREKGKTAIGGSFAFSKSTGLTGGA
jgi:hypothetical protein